MFFYSFFVFIILQRLCELVIAKRNEAWMKKQGAYEAGQSHYKWMVSMHVAFFAALFTEVYVLDRFMKKEISSKEYGLLTALGPGFSSEMLLLEWR